MEAKVASHFSGSHLLRSVDHHVGKVGPPCSFKERKECLKGAVFVLGLRVFLNTE